MSEIRIRAPIVRNQSVTARKLAFAKSLRRRMTPVEKRLWFALRGSKIAGLHFRRQQVVGNFIVDFYCEAARLTVELDGASHALRSVRDAQRDAALLALGVEVLRIPNEVILGDLDVVTAWIAERAIASRTKKNRPNPRPLPAREGEPESRRRR
ncbi:MAG: endonuclease domain-containing protein [Candidatus Binataceae bacterium]